MFVVAQATWTYTIVTDHLHARLGQLGEAVVAVVPPVERRILSQGDQRFIWSENA